ncbi:hypothetical protein SAMN05421548_13184 [Paraburkholderia lycopersici]|uniref:Uncharacterized protein n=1 Tax=Paraburkholderia lycopersici TaxID=416944 RepID=A0A1G6ZTE7_9BURK|nr:hypothetical protein SAMN05421548_13184 [Paraburkholderia lycopersici]
MLTSSLLLLGVAAVLGQVAWTRARASLQPVRVRATQPRRFR